MGKQQSGVWHHEDEEIECDILESYGIFSGNIKFWNKEVNLISWNKRPAKLDIRNWQRDHKKCGKGIAITREEAEELVKLLNKILKEKPGPGKTKKQAGTKKQSSRKLPHTLKPFYDELEIFFGAVPTECKSARNTLLKKYHPDRNSKNLDFATRKTIKIKEAYERIMEWWTGNR